MDGLTVMSTLIAAAGLTFSGWQLRLIHIDRQNDHQLGIKGVCISWRAVVAPNRADVDAEGDADWIYEFQVSNPGRFPVSGIKARIIFPSAVARVRHNGVVDKPDPVLELSHPVVPGGGTFTWAPRRLRMPFDESVHRPGIVATVSFLDSEGNLNTTKWPAVQRDD